MIKSDIEKALTVLQGIGCSDPELATRYIDPSRYREHNPHSADGIEGLKQFVREVAEQSHHLKVVRAFQDGQYVFTQADGLILGQNTFFDVFKLEDGLITEHWNFAAPSAPANQSGHTQLDGPTQARHLQDTEKNKAFMREYYETFHLAGDRSQVARYFDEDLCIRHEPGVRDGVVSFLRDVEAAMQHRTIDEIKLLLGQGNFVFIAAQGTYQGDPCAYIDLYRVENQKNVEHWGFFAAIPPREAGKNANGLL